MKRPVVCRNTQASPSGCLVFCEFTGAKNRYLVASDVDQTLSFSDSVYNGEGHAIAVSQSKDMGRLV